MTCQKIRVLTAVIINENIIFTTVKSSDVVTTGYFDTVSMYPQCHNKREALYWTELDEITCHDHW